MTSQFKSQQQNRLSVWVENHAGILVSIFFHLAIFSFLLTHVYQPIKEPVRLNKLNILLQPVLKQPNLRQSAQPSPQTSFPKAAATVPHPSEQVKPEEIKPSGEESPRETTAQDSSVNEHLSIERHKLMAELKELEQTRQRIRSQLDARLLQAKAHQGKYASIGVARGPVRTINFKGYPRSVVEKIMKRYGISIEQKFVGPGEPSIFVSYAETDNGVYVNRQGSGFYEVFELSRTALAAMCKLEQEELIRRGYDLNHTTVVKTVFGIVEKDGEYDLGVIELEAKQID